MSLAINILFALLCIALVFSVIRALIGPSLADRVVALELMMLITVGMIGVYTIATGVPHLIDVAVVLALTAFLAPVGFARYLEKRGVKDE